MKSPYLIQRLDAPKGYDNPFSFGGGKINGGINQEAFNVIKKIWSFDYMGSAEFEWGAVPAALQAMLDAELATIGLNDNIYIIAPKAIIDEVLSWVDKASVGETGHLKQHLGFVEALRGGKYARTKGWLKIEEDKTCKEPFMFFIDEQMYLATCEIFGVKPISKL